MLYRDMAINMHLVYLLIITVLVVMNSNQSSAESNNRNDKKDNMEGLFPLLFLLGGTPAMHCPAVWLMGTLCLGVMVFLGKGNLNMNAV